LGLVTAAAAPGAAQDGGLFRIDFAVGGLYSDVDTTSAKAEECRDLSDGFLLDDLELRLRDRLVHGPSC
jgi:hypothetical protein